MAKRWFWIGSLLLLGGVSLLAQYVSPSMILEFAGGWTGRDGTSDVPVASFHEGNVADKSMARAPEPPALSSVSIPEDEEGERAAARLEDDEVVSLEKDG